MSRRLSFLTAGLGLGTLAFHLMAVYGHDIGVIVNLFMAVTDDRTVDASPGVPGPRGQCSAPGVLPIDRAWGRPHRPHLGSHP